MTLSGITRSQCALDVLSFGAYLLGYMTIVKRGFAGHAVDEAGTDRRPLTVMLTIGLGVLSLIMVGLFSRMRHLGPASLGLTRRSLRLNSLLGLAVTAATFAVFYIGVLSIALLWPAGFAELKSNAGRIAATLPRLSAAGFAFLALFVGIYEEVVFRGFLLTRLRRLIGNWPVAILLSSAIFTVPHLGMQADATAAPLFGMAVLWSTVAWWRRSLVPVILGHFLFDWIQFLAIAAQNPGWR